MLSNVGGGEFKGTHHYFRRSTGPVATEIDDIAAAWADILTFSLSTDRLLMVAFRRFNVIMCFDRVKSLKFI